MQRVLGAPHPHQAMVLSVRLSLAIPVNLKRHLIFIVLLRSMVHLDLNFVDGVK